ncbi:MAG TPA: potassium transporter TrkG [Anaerolineales bacterium]|nr:potassium transporter TrkG [Anaerolineales bacterium]
MSKAKSPPSSKIKSRGSSPRQRLIQMGGSASYGNSRQVPVALQLVLGLIVLIGIGTALFMLPGASTRKLSLMEALFTSTSAAAVTGLSLLPVSTDLTFLGQLILLLLVQVGGVGLIVVVVLVFRLIGRQVTLGERLAVTSSLGLDRPQEIALIMVRAVGLMLVIEGIGAILLFLHWRISGIVPPGKAAFYAIFHAVTAYCNAGFDLFYGLPEYPNGIPTDPLSLIIMGALIILGGLGIPVYMDLIYRRRRSFSLHTRLTIVISLILILLGWIGFLVSEYRMGGVMSGMPFGQRALLAWFQSVSARTAGFAGLPTFTEINAPSSWMLVLFMFIGTAPASTGGGITTGTFTVLWLAVISYARGLDKIRVGKHSLPAALLMRSLVVFVISISLVVLATWLLLLTNPFSLDQILFEVVSAYSTTGLTLGITTGLNTIGKLIIIFTMFAGRLGAITIMISLMGHDKKRQLVEYPEESILVG